MNYLLRLRGVFKTYRQPAELSVLRGVDLEVRPGERIAVTGPSGSGKSTLLNLMGALDGVTSGSIEFGDRKLESMSPGEAAEYRNREIGFVFQLHHLLPQLTVLENVLLPLVPRGRRAVDGARERAGMLLDRVGLGDRIGYKPSLLSGGERQRVAVVRALVTEPRILLADEPTGSLDAENADSLTDLLVQTGDETGTALVVVTHSYRVAEKMQRRYSLSLGRLEAI
jgi:lipoprotein-releasing system ATP-binding protein